MEKFHYRSLEDSGIRCGVEIALYRILSIQSHVVYGYVGNKCAVFPLQLQGFEVDVINSVQLSNHTGYNSYPGQILNGFHIGDLIDGLKSNDLFKYTHFLLGYIGCESALKKIFEVISDSKKNASNIIIACDPVMGDNGKMYVPEEMLLTYRDYCLPLIDIIFPNQFEAEILSGIKIKSWSHIKSVLEYFHTRGINIVVITSTAVSSLDVLIAVVSKFSDNKRKQFQIQFPKLNANFTGAGDLFASLFLSRLIISSGDIKTSLEISVNIMQAVLRRTLESACNELKDADLSAQHLELKLIQSKEDILSPIIKFEALPFD